MCSYNRVNGDFACENKYLLTDVLKEELEVSRLRALRLGWHAQHGEGLGRRARQRRADRRFLRRQAEGGGEAGKMPMAELDDHVRRILRSEFASGIVDYPPKKSVVDVEGGFETARKIEEQSIVLLKNEKSVLPLDRAKVQQHCRHRIATPTWA